MYMYCTFSSLSGPINIYNAKCHNIWVTCKHIFTHDISKLHVMWFVHSTSIFIFIFIFSPCIIFVEKIIRAKILNNARLIINNLYYLCHNVIFQFCNHHTSVPTRNNGCYQTVLVTSLIPSLWIPTVDLWRHLS